MRHLTADTMVTMPSVGHEIVGFKMQQIDTLLLGHSATFAQVHLFVYEEMAVCKGR